MIEYEYSEVRDLAHDLGKVPGRVVPTVLAIVRRGAQNVKDEMVSEAESGGHYKHFSRSISYDQKISGFGSIEYEIGPDKAGPQGALGNILYFGTSKNGPVLDLEGPISREAPRFMREILNAAEGAI